MEKKIPLTKEGHKELSEELENLKSKERPEIIAAIAEARDHGDLKENAEYHAAREKQGFIEARIALLESNITLSYIIDHKEKSPKTISFGATVSLIDQDDNKKDIIIVHEIEADIKRNKISSSSPIGRALMGKEKGDTVEINAPNGNKEYEVIEIKYKS